MRELFAKALPRLEESTGNHDEIFDGDLRTLRFSPWREVKAESHFIEIGDPWIFRYAILHDSMADRQEAEG